jgi:8-oxo-dGTP pyrophosphatase MutT (NUDIX family)
MRATPVGSLQPKFDHKTPPKPGSVLILLYPDHDKILFPLTERPEYGGTHSGQVSLPGGKAEPGEDCVTTALREGEEEIGIAGAEVEILGRLSDFFVIPSNFKVIPVVGYLKTKPVFKADPIEVKKIIMADLYELLRDDSIKSKEILAAGRYPLMAPHFEIEGQVVWGATAMILNELRVVIRELLYK